MAARGSRSAGVQRRGVRQACGNRDVDGHRCVDWRGARGARAETWSHPVGTLARVWRHDLLACRRDRLDPVAGNGARPALRGWSPNGIRFFGRSPKGRLA